MAEYMSREDVYNALKAKYCNKCTFIDKECYRCAYADVMYNIDIMPAADVQPVKYGRWRKRMSTSDSLKCSVCGNNHEYPTTYCPNCGADMREADATKG